MRIHCVVLRHISYKSWGKKTIHTDKTQDICEYSRLGKMIWEMFFFLHRSLTLFTFLPLSPLLGTVDCWCLNSSTFLLHYLCPTTSFHHVLSLTHVLHISRTGFQLLYLQYKPLLLQVHLSLTFTIDHNLSSANIIVLWDSCLTLFVKLSITMAEWKGSESRSVMQANVSHTLNQSFLTHTSHTVTLLSVLQL